MKNAMQLKAIMKKLAKENQISAQLVLQNYMLERFLERVSLSPYRDNYIIKGGFLISSMVGLNSRATMDMDATIKGYPVTQDAVQKMIEQILTVPVDDDITFTFKSIGEIREGDEYTGYRVALTADFPPMVVPLKLDITTGDKITPREIQYDYKLMLEDRHIQVMAYNLATILAEKLETVISRSDQNTRPRDYYDVYILTKLQAENIDFPALGAALMATASKRGSDSILQDYRAIVEAVRNSEIMRRQWNNYRKDFDYASTISFDEVCDAVASTMDTLNSEFVVMLRQTKDIDSVVELYGLSEPQRKYLLLAQPGEGIIKMGNSLIPFNNPQPKDTKTYKLLTTKPGEME